MAVLTVLIGILPKRELRQPHKTLDHPNRKDAAYNTAPAASTVRRRNGWGKKGRKAWPVEVGGS